MNWEHFVHEHRHLGELLVFIEILAILFLSGNVLARQMNFMWTWRHVGNGLKQVRMMLAYGTFSIFVLALQRGSVWFDDLFLASALYGAEPSGYWPQALVAWTIELISVIWYSFYYFANLTWRQELHKQAEAGALQHFEPPQPDISAGAPSAPSL